MVLTKVDLLEMNKEMLGLGAPVVFDNVGYNKVDYDRMYRFAYVSSLSDKDALTIVSALKRYVNTQLVADKTNIEETLKFFEGKVKMVKVISYDEKGVVITWGYNKVISEVVKTLSKTLCHWTKVNGDWALVVTWDGWKTLRETFIEEGFGTGLVDVLKVTPKEVKPVEKKLIGNITVERGEIDTLIVGFPYDKALVAAVKTLKNASYIAKTKSWEIYIEDAGKFYDAVEKSGVAVGTKELKPWATMVKGWKKEYTLIDVNTLNLPFQPYSFQIEDAKIMLGKKNLLNANEVGCGKTFESIIVGESLPMKKLVICPPSLRINWKKEIEMVNPNANIHIIYSNETFEVVDGWNIIGYSSLEKFQKQLEKEKFQVVMMDEAHFIQALSNYGTPASKRAKAVLRLTATAGWVFPITGTPKTNRNKNLFNILRTIKHPLTRGKFAFANYGKMYCDGKRTQWGWDYEGNSNDKELNSHLVPNMVRHLKRDVLPNITKQRVCFPVEVDLREYNLEIEEYLRVRKNKNAVALARLTKAKQILAVKKAPETIDMANTFINQGKKVVIVTCFTNVVEKVEKAFAGNVCKIVGGMSDTEKDKAIRDFQDGEPMVMVINDIAGGVGVTLTASSTMIINDIPWTTGSIQQSEGRIWRSGQVDHCMVYFTCAVGAEMDEYLIKMITSKSSTINQVVDGGMGEEVDLRKLYEDSLD